MVCERFGSPRFFLLDRRLFLEPDVTGAREVIDRMSLLTCPECGHQAAEEMPTDACLYFYECSGCGAMLKPTAGDCCVFCSYGTVPARRRSPALVVAERSSGC